MKRRVPRLDGIAKKLAKGELIGLEARIAKANDDGLVGLRGELVDETLHTLTLRIGGPGGRRMQLAKSGTTWEVRTSPERDWVRIDGRAIGFRPADRTKKVR